MRTLFAHASLLVFSVLMGFALVLASPSKADPFDPAQDYADQYGTVICQTLDSYPSVPGMFGIAQGVLDNSTLSAYQAGRAVALAIIDTCPRHIGLLEVVARQQQPTGQVV